MWFLACPCELTWTVVPHKAGESAALTNRVQQRREKVVAEGQLGGPEAHFEVVSRRQIHETKRTPLGIHTDLRAAIRTV
jgi:hypothetical protein